MPDAIPTDRELEALKVIWSRGRATVREIWQSLRQTDRHLAYTTVLSLMQTMEQKKLVGHEAVGRAYHYFAAVEHDSTFQRLAKRFLDKVFDGAVDQYLVRALESKRLNADEFEKLEDMIATARKNAERRGKKGGDR